MKARFMNCALWVARLKKSARSSFATGIFMIMNFDNYNDSRNATFITWESLAQSKPFNTQQTLHCRASDASIKLTPQKDVL